MKVCLSCGQTFNLDGFCCPHCGISPQMQRGFVVFAPELAEINDGFPPRFFEPLSELEDRHFWFRCRNRLLFWAFNQWCRHAESLLEIGCGTGYVLDGFSRQFPHLRPAGSDIYLEALAFARKRLPSVDLFQMDACKIPFQNEFDVIGMFDVLEHISDDVSVLRQVYQAIVPGGEFLITVPQHPSLWSRIDEQDFHKRRYTRKDLTEKLVQSGFSILKVTSFVSLLLPIMAVSRWMSGFTKPDGDFDQLAELRIGDRPNYVMEQVLNMEVGLIKAGMSLPAGGSLLVVARKPAG